MRGGRGAFGNVTKCPEVPNGSKIKDIGLLQVLLVIKESGLEVSRLAEDPKSVI